MGKTGAVTQALIREQVQQTLTLTVNSGSAEPENHSLLHAGGVQTEEVEQLTKSTDCVKFPPLIL